MGTCTHPKRQLELQGVMIVNWLKITVLLGRAGLRQNQSFSGARTFYSTDRSVPHGVG